MLIFLSDYIHLIDIQQPFGYHLIDNHPGIAYLIALAEPLVDMRMELIQGHLILPYPGEEN